METREAIKYLIVLGFILIAYLWHRHNQQRFIREQYPYKHQHKGDTKKPDAVAKGASTPSNQNELQERRTHEGLEQQTESSKEGDTHCLNKQSSDAETRKDMPQDPEEESESVAKERTEPVASSPRLDNRRDLLMPDENFLKRHLDGDRQETGRGDTIEQRGDGAHCKREGDVTDGDENGDSANVEVCEKEGQVMADVCERSKETCDETEELVESENGPEVDEEKAMEMKSTGNELFKAGKHEESLTAYSQALDYLPKKAKEQAAILFSNMAAVHLGQQQWEQALESAASAIEICPSYAKAYLRRYKANAGLDKIHDAVADLKKACELDDAIRSTYRLELSVMEKKSALQFEKEKEEMMGKLKDFGNWALGKVGMSVDNFKVVQDPASGSYNIQYKPPGQNNDEEN